MLEGEEDDHEDGRDDDDSKRDDPESGFSAKPRASSSPGKCFPLELLFLPPIELVGVGEDMSFGRLVQPMHGKSELVFPSAAGPFGAPQVGGNGFPALEDAPFRHGHACNPQAFYYLRCVRLQSQVGGRRPSTDDWAGGFALPGLKKGDKEGQRRTKTEKRTLSY
jgi:hypothetical protein